MNTGIVYNANCSHQLAFLDFKKIDSERQDAAEVWFTCSSVGSTPSGKEFIALATSDGRIFRVQPENDGVNFTKGVDFSMGMGHPITAIAFDPSSKVFMIGTGAGHVIFMNP